MTNFKRLKKVVHESEHDRLFKCLNEGIPFIIALRKNGRIENIFMQNVEILRPSDDIDLAINNCFMHSCELPENCSTH